MNWMLNRPTMPMPRPSFLAYWRIIPLTLSEMEKLGYTLPEKLTWDFVWEVSQAATKKDGDGNYHLVDYKTDRIYPDSELERAESYRPQLEVYADALEKIVQKPVKASYIYFFETGRTVKVL